MGKLILCSGERTKRPYGFTPTGIRLYSMEELCYFLYNHVYMIEEDMLSNDLFEWLGAELKLPERAQKLKQLKKQGADLKTIVTVILCSSDYYSESEIKCMLRKLDEVIGMPPVKRNCIKADSCLKNKQYAKAQEEYEKIINSTEAADLTPEEYGDIYHNLAVAKMHITGLSEASRLFVQAYKLNHREESLKQYLITLRLCGNDDNYHKFAEEYQAGEELKDSLSQLLQQKESEAENSELHKEIENLKIRKMQGRISEFYQMSEDILDAWKMQIRQM